MNNAMDKFKMSQNESEYGVGPELIRGGGGEEGSENKNSPSQALMEKLMARTRPVRKIMKTILTVICTGTGGSAGTIPVR